MAINIGDNFKYQGKNPLDSRMLFDTIAAMKNYNENYLPDLALAQNKEDGKLYTFNRLNDVDEDTGKWRVFESESGEIFTDSVYLTQTEFDNLTQEEQDDPKKDYYILSNGQTVPSDGITLAELDDTNISSPTNKQVVQYNGTSGVWENGQLDLATLSDTTISSPKKGQVLKYNSTAETYENKDLLDDDISIYKINNVALKASGNVFTFADWNCWFMIPMKTGDSISISGMSIASDPNYRQRVIYDSTGAVTSSGTGTTSVSKTFDSDGYFSFITMNNSTPTIKISRNAYTTSSLNTAKRLSMDLMGYTEVDECEEYRQTGYLLNNGTVQPKNDWRTYIKVPVNAGEKVYLGAISSVSSNTAKGCIIYDSDGTTVLHSSNRGAGWFATNSKIYVSMCYEVTTQSSTKPLRVWRKRTFDDLLTLAKSEETPNPTYWTAIGDSITAGDEGNTGNSYSRTAATMLGADKVSLQNLGYWGHTMKQSAGTAFNAIRSGTKIITINFGSNDIFVLGPSQWGDVDEIIAKDASNLAYNVSSFESLRKFIEDCRTSFPAAMVYVITPIKRGTTQSQPDWNAACKKLCDYYSIPVLDAFGECGIRYTDSLYKRDGIHPNDAGCTIFARWLINKINFL